ncbi:MAG TPA: hypothetical protein VL383_12570, partial [Gemmatimonadaceae bacterium]|nr:hypothetical protein [Gemmatimonadaceae bacterium]
ELDAPTIAGMRGALMTELSHTLGVAAPQIVQKFATTKAPRAARRAPEPDALDALLERASHKADEEDQS